MLAVAYLWYLVSSRYVQDSQRSDSSTSHQSEKNVQDQDSAVRSPTSSFDLELEDLQASPHFHSKGQADYGNSETFHLHLDRNVEVDSFDTCASICDTNSNRYHQRDKHAIVRTTAEARLVEDDGDHWRGEFCSGDGDIRQKGSLYRSALQQTHPVAVTHSGDQFLCNKSINNDQKDAEVLLRESQFWPGTTAVSQTFCPEQNGISTPTNGMARSGQVADYIDQPSQNNGTCCQSESTAQLFTSVTKDSRVVVLHQDPAVSDGQVCGDAKREQWRAHQNGTRGSGQHDEEQASGGPKFSPPVYVQRYSLVQKILHEHAVESVVDFGCAELKFFRWLKDFEHLHRVFLVDLDANVLESHKHCVKPLNLDYIFPRPSPLAVTVLAGSAGDLDHRIVGCQAATLIELIEHLEPDVLKQVTHCVFGRLRPSLVVVTTPNADFNILFPNFTGFRHWDHKFEWTRCEFQDWCNAVCKEHGYSVTYTGVGDPPGEMSHVGHCSQAAIFTETAGIAGETTEEKVYELVQAAEYPADKRTPEEQLSNEVDYIVNSSYYKQKYLNDDETVSTVPVSDIAHTVTARQKSRHWSQDDVVKYLRGKHKLTENGEAIVIQLSNDDEEEEEEDGDYFDPEDFRFDDDSTSFPPASPVAMEDEESWD